MARLRFLSLCSTLGTLTVSGWGKGAEETANGWLKPDGSLCWGRVPMARLTNDSLKGGAVILYCMLVYSAAPGEIINNSTVGLATIGTVGISRRPSLAFLGRPGPLLYAGSRSCLPTI